MNNADLLQRRQQLVARSAQLRLALVDQAQAFEHPLAVTDQALNGLRWVARNPLWPLAFVLIALAARPHRVLRWGHRMWWAWKLLTRTRHWVARYLGPQAPA